MAQTRASKAAPKGTVRDTKPTKTDDVTSQSNTLPPSSAKPAKLCILPKSASPSAFIVTLLHPRYNKPSSYLMCPETGMYEFTRVTSPKSSPRSWLLEPETPNGTVSIAKNPDFLVVTKIDVLFLLLPVLSPKSREHSKRMFLSFEHYLETLAEGSADMPRVLSSEKMRNLLEKAMRQVCDTVKAGDESMFRLNDTKLLQYLLNKAQMFANPTLPASLEDQFVTPVLAMPIKNTPSSGVTTNRSTDDPNTTSQEEAKTSSPNSQPPPDIIQLQRQKIALRFICARYISPELTKDLSNFPSTGCEGVSTDFAPLEKYLKDVAKLKQQALATRSLVDYTRKRGLEEDDEASERADKKNKKEEEEKRKNAGASRGVKELKKVNVTGMKKMSDFFKKK